MSFYIINGFAHGASNATSVVKVAIYKLLLWEALEFAMEDLAGGLETGHCGKSPTRSAFSLVLDRANSTLGSPVDIDIGNWCAYLNYGWLVDWLNLWSVISLIGKVGLGKLLLSQSRELVNSSSVWSGGVSVMFLNEEFLLGEQFESVKVFQLRIVLYVEILFPLIILCKDIWRGMRGLCKVVHT